MAEASPAITILICEGLFACRFEEQGFGRQSPVGEGLLLAGSPRLYVVMHAAEQHVDLSSSRLWANGLFSPSPSCHRPSLAGDEHAGFRLDARETAADRAYGARTHNLGGEGILAAGASR